MSSVSNVKHSITPSGFGLLWIMPLIVFVLLLGGYAFHWNAVGVDTKALSGNANDVASRALLVAMAALQIVLSFVGAGVALHVCKKNLPWSSWVVVGVGLVVFIGVMLGSLWWVEYRSIMSPLYELAATKKINTSLSITYGTCWASVILVVAACCSLIFGAGHADGVNDHRELRSQYTALLVLMAGLLIAALMHTKFTYGWILPDDFNWFGSVKSFKGARMNFLMGNTLLFTSIFCVIFLPTLVFMRREALHLGRVNSTTEQEAEDWLIDHGIGYTIKGVIGNVSVILSPAIVAALSGASNMLA